MGNLLSEVNATSMMTRIISIALIAGLLHSCKLVNPEHDFHISGVLMYHCESDDPMGNVKLQFDVNGETFASTKTNAHGEFTLSGTAIERGGGYGNIPYLAINYTPSNGGAFHYRKIAILPIEGAIMDTLYYRGTDLVEMQLNLSGSNYTDQDTLYAWYPVPHNVEDYSFTSSYGDEYMIKYPGPFKNGALDTVLMEGHSHPKYHNDSPHQIYYWVNDSEEWKHNLNKSYWVRYSPSGILEKPAPGCNEVTEAILEL